MSVDQIFRFEIGVLIFLGLCVAACSKASQEEAKASVDTARSEVKTGVDSSSMESRATVTRPAGLDALVENLMTEGAMESGQIGTRYYQRFSPSWTKKMAETAGRADLSAQDAASLARIKDEFGSSVSHGIRVELRDSFPRASSPRELGREDLLFIRWDLLTNQRIEPWKFEKDGNGEYKRVDIPGKQAVVLGEGTQLYDEGVDGMDASVTLGDRDLNGRQGGDEIKFPEAFALWFDFPEGKLNTPAGIREFYETMLSKLEGYAPLLSRQNSVGK